MNIQQNKQIRKIFMHVIELPKNQAETYINTTTNDPEIKKQVLELLNTYENNTIKTDNFINDIAENISNSTLLFPSDRYTLIKKIGQGGMGDVYLAQRKIKDIKTKVAIKILQQSDDFSKQRFSQETSILSQLSHPNISTFIDADFLNDGRPYVVMEYTPGQTISNYCQHNNLTINDRIILFLKLCEAVQHAHRNLIIHRDIKPENILVNKSGQLKLLDFGIAKIQQDISNQESKLKTLTHLRAMTPAYASPEQFMGQAISVSSDVYSLGVILYELFTGVRPYNFNTVTPVEIEKKLNNTTPVKPSDKIIDSLQSKDFNKVDARWSAKLKGDLDNIVSKSLQVDVTQRYQTVAELTEDLQSYQNNLPIKAHKPGFGYISKKFIKRNKALVATSLLISALVISFVIVVLSQNKAITKQSEELVVQRNQAIKEKDKATIEQKRAEILSDTFIQAFKSADPTKTNGENISALDILEQAKQLIMKSASNKLLKAQMLLAISEVYRNLEKYSEASELLTEIGFSYDLLTKDEKILFRSEKALVAFWQGISEEQVLEDINSAISELGIDSRLIYAKGFLYRIMSQYQPVIDELGSYFVTLDSSDEFYIPICSVYGYALSSSGYFKKGKLIFQKCLGAIENNSLNLHLWDKSQILFQMGRLNTQLKQYDQAISLFNQSKQIQLDLFHAENVSITDIDIYIGNVLVLSGKPDKALPFIENAIHGRKKLRDNPSSLSKPLFSKAKAYIKMGKSIQAEALLLEAIELRKKAGVEFALNTAFQYQYLGRVYMKLNKIEQAKIAYSKTIEIFEAPKYSSIYRIAETRVLLAQVYYINGDYQEAKKLLELSLPDMYTMHDETDEIRLLAENMWSELNLLFK